MDRVEHKIRSLSHNQLKALSLLGQAEGGLASSSSTGIQIGITGKSLGGVFSSLCRQIVFDQALIIPFGRGEVGRGLRWKVNERLISVRELNRLVKEVLGTY